MSSRVFIFNECVWRRTPFLSHLQSLQPSHENLSVKMTIHLHPCYHSEIRRPTDEELPVTLWPRRHWLRLLRIMIRVSLRILWFVLIIIDLHVTGIISPCAFLQIILEVKSVPIVPHHDVVRHVSNPIGFRSGNFVTFGSFGRDAMNAGMPWWYATQARGIGTWTDDCKIGRDSGADKVQLCTWYSGNRETGTGNGKRETNSYKSLITFIVLLTVIITIIYALIQHDQYVH